MDKKGGMNPMKFRKMIQIMKSSEVNINVEKLQRLFKEKQKREENEQKTQNKKGTNLPEIR